MPFADAGCRISLPLQQRGQVQTLRLLLKLRLGKVQHFPAVPRLHGRTPRVPVTIRHPPAQQAIPARHADRPARVSIRETHPLRRQFVDVRRRNLRLRIEALRVAIAHVIYEQDEDVGFGWWPRRLIGREYGHRREQQCGEECAGGIHDLCCLIKFVAAITAWNWYVEQT